MKELEMSSSEDNLDFSKFPMNVREKLMEIGLNLLKPTRNTGGNENGYLLVADIRHKNIYDPLTNKNDMNYNDALYLNNKQCKYIGQKKCKEYDELLERIGNNKLDSEIRNVILLIKSGSKVISLYKVIKGVEFTKRSNDPPYIDIEIKQIDLSKYKYKRQRTDKPDLKKILSHLEINIILRRRQGINPVYIGNEDFLEDLIKL